MYIIPKEKIKKIESEVKPDFLKNVNSMVEQGISAALGKVGTKIVFTDPCLAQWCNNLGQDLMDPGSEIFYKNITESHPDSLMTIYKKFRSRYNYTITIGSRTYPLFGKRGWNRARGIADLSMAKKFLESCFPYNEFASKNAQYDAYRYCKAMDINVCVYCNAQLTHTVIRDSKKTIRPQIDHFFPQSRFPMFALSFYNMIPSCQVCNSIKRAEFCDLDKIYHPYVDVRSDFRFIWRYNKLWMAYGSEKAENTAKMLHTEDVYNMYVGVAEKIVEKVQDYDPVYIDDIMELMNRHRPKNKQLDKEMVIRRIYDYVPKEECFDTPLGEMRHDILEDKIEKAYE